MKLNYHILNIQLYGILEGNFIFFKYLHIIYTEEEYFDAYLLIIDFDNINLVIIYIYIYHTLIYYIIY